MHPSGEILRSTALFVAGLVAMLIVIAVLGLYVQRSIGREPNLFPVSILEQEKSLRTALPVACRVGS
jgi:hypothetical protein